MEAETELRGLGLKPLTWPEVLDAVKARLAATGTPAAGTAGSDWERFSRLHRSFVGYGSEDNLTRFYGFVYSKGLHREINGFRFHRLAGILAGLWPRLKPGLRILEVGAGGGFLAEAVSRKAAPDTYMVQDLCAEARALLASSGFPVLPHPPPSQPPGPPFDLILCADSLGEINSDDDGDRSGRGRSSRGEDVGQFDPVTLEQRYGFAFKLEVWKPYLAPDGCVLLWEPFSQPGVWDGLCALLRDRGWSASLETGSAQTHPPFLQLRPA